MACCIQPPVPGLGQFPATTSMSVLNGVNGFRLDGTISSGHVGISVSAGDVNNDGIEDVVIGASGGAGKTYIVFGKTSGWASSISLGTLNGTDGFTLIGEASTSRSGSFVGTADINNDNLTDVIIGAYEALSYEGRAYVVFGNASAWPSSVSLSTLNGANGFTLDGLSPDDRFGSTGHAGGDVNHDGIDDFIIGGYLPSAFVVFGKANPWTSSISLNTLDGINGFRLDSEASSSSIDMVGDVNNDGINDIIVGTSFDSPNLEAGKTYVVFGKASGWTSSLSLSALDGTNGFALTGVAASDHSGYCIRTGDINNDGIDDILIGSPNANSLAGKTYVVFGKTSGWTSSISLSTLNGNNGFVINGESKGDRNGVALSVADINNDGVGDIIISANLANSSAGKVYVVFGKASGWTSSISLSTLNGTDGFALTDVSSAAVSTGDINHDGVADMILGALFAGNSNAGKTYVVFGDSPPVLEQNTLTIGEGCAVTLDSTYLAAYDLNHANSTLTFTASNVINGKFQKVVGGVVTNFTTPIFTQSDVTNGYIHFVSTSFEAPSYSMAVSSTGGFAFVPARPAVVSFTAPVCQSLTSAPTQMPTVRPSAMPTVRPSAMPTVAPTALPTGTPTFQPTRMPTSSPTSGPTVSPTASPTAGPTLGPTVFPTVSPTAGPTVGPTTSPTVAPTRWDPSFAPSVLSTRAPSAPSTRAPSAAVVSSATRTSPAWYLPGSQVVSLLDATLPAAYQSISGYLSGLDASSQSETHNDSFESVSAQLMLGVVVIKLAQKGINWAQGFWN